jgi:acyl carrier protein
MDETMRETEVYAFLTELFHDVFLRDDIVLSPDLSAKDVEGWDSIKQVEIVIGTEEHYSIKFTTRELDRLQCVGDLASAVMSKVEGRL